MSRTVKIVKQKIYRKNTKTISKSKLKSNKKKRKHTRRKRKIKRVRFKKHKKSQKKKSYDHSFAKLSNKSSRIQYGGAHNLNKWAQLEKQGYKLIRFTHAQDIDKYFQVSNQQDNTSLSWTVHKKVDNAGLFNKFIKYKDKILHNKSESFPINLIMMTHAHINIFQNWYDIFANSALKSTPTPFTEKSKGMFALVREGASKASKTASKALGKLLPPNEDELTRWGERLWQNSVKIRQLYFGLIKHANGQHIKVLLLYIGNLLVDIFPIKNEGDILKSKQIIFSYWTNNTQGRAQQQGLVLDPDKPALNVMQHGFFDAFSDTDTGSEAEEEEEEQAEEEEESVNVNVIKNTSVNMVPDPIGKGTFGTVFKGVWERNLEDKVQVACKQIMKASFQREAEQRFIDEVINECKILGSLHHPSFLNLYGIVIKDENEDVAKAAVAAKKKEDLFEISRLETMLVERAKNIHSIYIITGLCKTTLKEHIHIDRGKLDRGEEEYWSQVGSQLECLRQISDGMEYLHKMKIIHRDLKLENVLVSIPSENPNTIVYKIIDFGFSYMQIDGGENENMEGGIGTILYMAPEMISYGNELNTHPFACDIFSYGILASGVLTYNKRLYSDDVLKWGGRNPQMFVVKVFQGVLRPDIIQGIAPYLPKEAAEGLDEDTLIPTIENIVPINEQRGKLYKGLIELISQCWADDVGTRGKFTNIKVELNRLIKLNSDIPPPKYPIIVEQNSSRSNSIASSKSSWSDHEDIKRRFGSDF